MLEEDEAAVSCMMELLLTDGMELWLIDAQSGGGIIDLGLRPQRKHD